MNDVDLLIICIAAIAINHGSNNDIAILGAVIDLLIVAIYLIVKYMFLI